MDQWHCGVRQLFANLIFVDMMKEIDPNWLTRISTRINILRRHRSGEEPVASKPRASEVLSVEEVQELISAQEKSWECLMSEYMRKKISKELPHSNNPPDVQTLVQEGKRVEWATILSKPNAVKIHYGTKAKRIKQEECHRFIGSRFVLTRKPLEEGLSVDPLDSDTFTVKGRWCLQGHLDPDLSQKAELGLLKSPTLSQLGRVRLTQTIASCGWTLQLGGIKERAPQ